MPIAEKVRHCGKPVTVEKVKDSQMVARRDRTYILTSLFCSREMHVSKTGFRESPGSFSGPKAKLRNSVASPGKIV